MSATRMPTIFLPHGGGPCFFMDWNPPDTWNRMAAWLRGVIATLPEKPKAIVVVSGHWEADAYTVTANAQPPLIFDYYGFPPHTYQLKFPAPGSPTLAARIVDLLQGAGLPAAEDAQRGFDHGVFIPMKLVTPDADIPVVQLSLHNGLSPAEHMAAGKALEPLRDEGVLIVGSGMSFHNMRRFSFGPTRNVDPDSLLFDAWLVDAVGQEPAQRAQTLAAWAAAPGGRGSHPREEHLIPLHVIAGAGGEDAGTRIFADHVMGSAQSAFQFG